MNSDDVIKNIREKLGEWLEMSNTPNLIIAHSLANQVLLLKEEIFYLEKHIEYLERNQQKKAFTHANS